MILITGGLGFVGSNLAESLVNDGESILLVSRTNKKLRNIEHFASKVNIEYGDVANTEWIRDIVLKYAPSIIVNFAAQVSSNECFESPFYDIDVNCKSTIAILEAMRVLNRPCRLILGSTFWVVGKPNKLPINESTRCNPLSLYAANRLACEHYCKIYQLVYGLDTVIMRLGNVFGAKEQFDNSSKAALNFIIYQGYKGKPITLYRKGKMFRDYIYISDVVSATKVIMEKGKTGECYFVGRGEKTWFYDIGRWIEELTLGRIVYAKQPKFNSLINVGNIVIDNRKIMELGWEWKVTVKEGIRKTVEYYHQSGL